ncbi:hypothetical protein CIB48_g6248 [Xylaria polymorpha]|nr:hypothetical protein CIB48_g6248 [Xylaria polymorpha]
MRADQWWGLRLTPGVRSPISSVGYSGSHPSLANAVRDVSSKSYTDFVLRVLDLSIKDATHSKLVSAFHPARPGPQFTPTRSFNETVQTTDAQGLDWADKQAKEHEAAKSRLSDHKFNIRDYADPLLPRQQPPPPHYYPRGVTAEMENRLLDLVSTIKEETQEGDP